jgi:hypothetical protein
VAVAFKHKHFLPQVAIAKMGLKNSPIFTKQLGFKALLFSRLSEVCVLLGSPWNYSWRIGIEFQKWGLLLFEFLLSPNHRFTAKCGGLHKKALFTSQGHCEKPSLLNAEPIFHNTLWVQGTFLFHLTAELHHYK